jgi:O-antigen/teichoic acid export membrane protein
LMTKLSPCIARGHTEQARRYISSAYLVVSATALAGCALLWAISHVIPWSTLFNVRGSVTAADARGVALACLTGFLVNMPLSRVGRVQYACQRVGMSNVWQALGSAVSLPLAIGAVQAKLSPVLVVTSVVAAPVLVNLVNTAWTYGRCLPQFAPRLGSVDKRSIRDLFRLSGMFFLVTIVMTLADNADFLIVAHALSLSALTSYAVPAKFFTQLGLLMMLVNQPLWPMHGEALARGEVSWVQRTVRRMTVVSALAVLVPAVILNLFGYQFFSGWLSVPVPVADRWLLAGLGLWWVLLATMSPRFMVQNAAGVLRPQVIGYSLYLVVSLLGKFLAVRSFGMAVVPWVGIASFLLTVVPAALYGYRRALSTNSTLGGAISDGARV